MGSIQDFSLEIQDREFLVLTGPVGSGVTRLLRLIAGLDRPSQGEVSFGSRSIVAIGPAQREVALVPGHYLPYPRMTVRNNLVFALRMRKRPLPEIEKRVASAVELSGLQELLDRKPETLSLEQRQRLAIAHAIALGPKVVLFDNVLSGLDEMVRRALRNEITKLHQRLQVTMVYGTHDPAEALGMGGRLVVIKAGRIEQAGEPLSLYQTPINTFVAEFVAGMNLVAGTLKQERGSWVFVERDQGTIKLLLPAEKISKISESQVLGERPVLLGVRPGDIEMKPETGSGKEPDWFPAIIDHVELMAGAVNLCLNTGVHSLRCSVHPVSRAADAGRRSAFRIDLDQVRLFDSVSRQRIA